MRGLRKGTASAVRVRFVTELLAGLEAFPATKPLAVSLGALNAELEKAAVEKRQKSEGLPKLRAALRLAEYQVDSVLRELWRAAEVADGGRRGPLSVALFPEGLLAVIAPSGTKQIEPTAAFLARLAETRTPGVDALREQYRPRVEQALQALRNTATAYQTLTSTIATLYARELVLRDEHDLALDRTIGLVRAAYPRDPAIHRVIFPPTAREVAASGDDDDEPEIAEPAA